MGYMIHHSIVVTSWNAKSLAESHDFAVASGACVSPIVAAKVNGIGSFLVAPDGSKEDWEESDSGDEQRESIKAFLASKACSDRSTALAWFEVSFPEDERPKVAAHGYKRTRG